MDEKSKLKSGVLFYCNFNFFFPKNKIRKGFEKCERKVLLGGKANETMKVCSNDVTTNCYNVLLAQIYFVDDRRQRRRRRTIDDHICVVVV